MSNTTSAPPHLLSLTAEIVAAHAGHNTIASDQLPQLIRSVHQALGSLEQRAEAPRPPPAVSIRQSITTDHIACLECGARMSMLKRHLRTEHNLTPQAYRERWGLAADYPMVSRRYTEFRSGLAKRLGLGRKPAALLEEAEPAAKASPAAGRSRRQPSSKSSKRH